MTNPTTPAEILMVDDNEDDIELALLGFQEAHLANPVEVVRSGEEALDRLFRRTLRSDGRPYRLPDLILLDLKMPGVGGLEVLRQLKAEPILKMIPVVILTSSSQEGDRMMSYATGANSYLVKPVSLDGMIRLAGGIEDYWLSLNVGPPLSYAHDETRA
jgi:CheY-like chemotaxis protein